VSQGRVGTIYAGTSGWAYASWKPGFYPADLSSASFLNYYATRLNSVEVNYTFGSMVTDELLRTWIRATPAHFQFAIKAHYSITHVKRLRKAARAAAEFLEAIEPLRKARKLGPVLFQLPPNLKCDLPLLKAFLAKLPRRTRAAFEFRHTSWFRDDVYHALRKAHVALCLAESAKIETPAVRTTDFSYLRLRKDLYPPKARKELAEKVAYLKRHGDVYVYFKHEGTPEGAKYAEKLLKPTEKG
jgi:uncharacterized protein YecE (DUF72 family)